jgi:hypothetical protein
MMYNSAEPQKIISLNDKLLVILDCSHATGTLRGTLEGIIFYDIRVDVHCAMHKQYESRKARVHTGSKGYLKYWPIQIV